MTETLDPVRLEIIRNALVAAAEEMSVAIRRTARSMMVREGSDFSTAVFDVQGRNVAQAALIPIHLNTMAPCLQEVLERFIPADQWADGDVVIVNDPYCGGQHLPDVTTFRPIFAEGALIGFTGVMCHHTDIGGGVPGSYNMRATEVFAEGIRIPPVRLFRQGTLNQELLAVVLQNVREPDIFKPDLMAQVGALDIGCRNIEALARKYGRGFLLKAANQILAQSEAAMRRAIAAIPDGAYVFEDVVDDEADPGRSYRIAVKLIVKDDRVVIDLTGSSPQADSPINCTLNIAKSCIYYAVMTGIADRIPPNSGCYAAIDIVAPKGSIVNCAFPAPVVNRIQVGHRIVNTIMGALSKAIPDRIPAAPYGVTYIYALEAVLEDGRRKIFFDSEIGGWGAEPQRDGANGFPSGLHNVANVPIEVHEATSPVTFTCSGFLADSGGAGKYRGGLGLVREWRLEAPRGSLTATLNRIRSRPYGLAGGEPGSCGRLLLIRANGEVVPLTGLIDRVPVHRGDRIRLETSGGGGFGPPAERDPGAIELDARNRYVSPVAADQRQGTTIPA